MRCFEQRLRGAESDPSSPAALRTPQLQAFAEALTSGIQQHNEHLEGKLEGMLDHVSVCLQEELSREQEHLMLMQHKLDSQSQTLSKTVADLTKRMDAEKNSRLLIQRSVRENKDALHDRIIRQQSEIDSLKSRLERVEAGGLSAVVRACKEAWCACIAACWPDGVARSRYATSQDSFEGHIRYEPLSEPLSNVAEPRLAHSDSNMIEHASPEPHRMMPSEP